MTDPRWPRGALARLALVCAIGLALLFAAIGPGHAAGRYAAPAPQPMARSAAIDAAAGGLSGVLAFAARFLGQGDPTHLGMPWCKSFSNFVLRRTGHRAGPSLMAIDALSDGVRVRTPRPGDLAVMRGHVTFFVRLDGRGGFVGLGGNQGHRVRFSRFALRAVVGFVRPTST